MTSGVRKNVNRARAALAVAVIALLAAVLGGGPVAAQERETEGLIPPGDWTDEQIDYLLDLIERTTEILPQKFPATATREELDDALLPLGYFDFGVPAPGGYWHYINAEWLFDDHVVDPEFPESLVYQQTGEDTFELVSAMFMLAPGIEMEDLPEDIAWLPGWHGHPELCTGPNGTFAGITDPDDPNCPEGSRQATTPLMFHVWIAEENPCDHRFGGIGVGGVHCDHQGHDPGHEEPGHEEPGHEEPGHEEPGHEDPGHGDGHDDPGHGDDGSHDSMPTAPPATPIVAQPTYTG